MPAFALSGDNTLSTLRQLAGGGFSLIAHYGMLYAAAFNARKRINIAIV
jgi:hypothetical protein